MWKFLKKCAILLSDTYFSPQETERTDFYDDVYEMQEKCGSSVHNQA